jgi:hypothetical protein
MGVSRGLLSFSIAWLVATLAPSTWGIDSAHADGASKPTVTFSWDGRFFMQRLPHGKEFLIEFEVPADHTFEKAELWRDEGECDKSERNVETLLFVSDKKKVTIDAPALKFATAYCFRFSARTGLGADGAAAIVAAVEEMVRAISDQQLYQPGPRQQFLHDKLGELADRPLRVTEQKGDEEIQSTTTVGEWTFAWTEKDSRLVALWQGYGDLESARKKVVKNAGRAHGYGLEDIVALYPSAVPAELQALQAARDALRSAVEDAGFANGTRPHLQADAEPPALTAAAARVRELADATRQKAEAARVRECGARPRPAGSTSELTGEIDRLLREIASLQQQIAGGGKKSAVAQWRSRLQAATATLHERRHDRLCKHLVSVREYNRVLAKALSDETAEAGAIAALQADMGKSIVALKAAIPVSVVTDAMSGKPTYTERATAYISADVGAVLPRFSTGNWGASLFVGVNLSFRPVDKDISLSEDGGFGKRFSLVAGLTVTEFRDNDRSVSGIAGGAGALLGVGYRVSDYLRVGAGGVLFRQKHPNPAIDSQSLRVAPYLALSVDADVVGLIRELFDKGKKSAL